MREGTRRRSCCLRQPLGGCPLTVHYFIPLCFAGYDGGQGVLYYLHNSHGMTKRVRSEFNFPFKILINDVDQWCLHSGPSKDFKLLKEVSLSVNRVTLPGGKDQVLFTNLLISSVWLFKLLLKIKVPLHQLVYAKILIL